LENKLRSLYALQQVDLSLDELEEMKGDLPAEIRELEEKEATLKAQLAALEHTMKTSFAQRDNADGEIVALQAKTEKYKAQ
jgi:predicted  nucleic acid-binding Zn-ribbon protein